MISAAGAGSSCLAEAATALVTSSLVSRTATSIASGGMCQAPRTASVWRRAQNGVVDLAASSIGRLSRWLRAWRSGAQPDCKNAQSGAEGVLTDVGAVH